MADLRARAAARSDAEDFLSLYQQFAPRVKVYMMAGGADAHAAEELAQETLLMAWRKATLCTGDAAAAAKRIFTIARNLRIDRVRREVPWQTLPVEAGEGAPAATTADPSIGESAQHRSLRAVLSELPPDQAEVLKLTFIDGLSPSAIAVKLAVPAGDIKGRLRLVSQRIRAALRTRA